MRLGITCLRKRLDKVFPMLFVFRDVQSKKGDERVVNPFRLSIPLRAVYRCGKFLNPEERAKEQEELAYKLGPPSYNR